VVNKTEKKKIKEIYKEALKKAINRNFWHNWAIQTGKEYQRLKKQKRKGVN